MRGLLALAVLLVTFPLCAQAPPDLQFEGIKGRRAMVVFTW